MRTIAATAVLLSVVLLAGCQASTFAVPPLAAGPCEPALAGRWLSVDDGRAGEDSELKLHIDAGCRLVAEQREGDRRVRSEPTPLHLARHGGHAYAWLDANWVMRTGREEHRFPDGDVVVVRWRLEGDELQVWRVADRPLAHAIIDGHIEGETRYASSELYNRVNGRPGPQVLEFPGLFADDAGVFRRAPGR